MKQQQQQPHERIHTNKREKEKKHATSLFQIIEILVSFCFPLRHIVNKVVPPKSRTLDDDDDNNNKKHVSDGFAFAFVVISSVLVLVCIFWFVLFMYVYSCNSTQCLCMHALCMLHLYRVH